MQQHQIVSREQWLAARKVHLAHEKEFSQARERLALPCVKEPQVAKGACCQG
jgi:predicted dithiol-disulfide oxidoreductase (DUF899 family)